MIDTQKLAQEQIDMRREVEEELTFLRRAVVTSADSTRVKLENLMREVAAASQNGIELPQSDTLDESLTELIQALQRWHGEFRTVKR